MHGNNRTCIMQLSLVMHVNDSYVRTVVVYIESHLSPYFYNLDIVNVCEIDIIIMFFINYFKQKYHFRNAKAIEYNM